MNFDIKHQEEYSRGQLLLRAFFGWAYIAIPHGFLLSIFSIWTAIQSMLAPWIVLFTGNIPQSWFEWRVKMLRWSARYYSSVLNLTDEKAALGLDGESDAVTLEIEQPAELNRVLNFLVAIKAIMVIPQFIVLGFRLFIASIIMGLAFWIVLFTGSYPAGMHNFVVATLRLQYKVSAYTGFLTDEYPPFS